MPIRTAIITDQSWKPTDEEEREDIERDLRRGGLDIRVAYSGRDFKSIPTLDVDLLVVDFGGLMHSYSSPAADYMRLTREWADEHPSGFVFLWSTMTGDYLAQLLRSFNDNKGWYDDVVWPANMRPLDKGYTLSAYGDGNWSDWRDESWRMAKSWFGVTVEEEEKVVEAHKAVRPGSYPERSALANGDVPFPKDPPFCAVCGGEMLTEGDMEQEPDSDGLFPEWHVDELLNPLVSPV